MYLFGLGHAGMLFASTIRMIGHGRAVMRDRSTGDRTAADETGADQVRSGGSLFLLRQFGDHGHRADRLAQFVAKVRATLLQMWCGRIE